MASEGPEDQISTNKLLSSFFAFQFYLNFSEQSVQTVEAILFFDRLRVSAFDAPPGMETAMRALLSDRQFEALDPWLETGERDTGNRGLSYACYTTDVARLNLGGKWAVQRGLFRSPRVGVEFNRSGRTVFEQVILGSSQYLDLKSKVTGTSRQRVTLDSTAPDRRDD